MAEIRFVPVAIGDLPMLAGWLRVAGVARWWPDADRQIAELRAHLDDPAIRQVIARDGPTPLGYAQHYLARHWPAPHLRDLPADAIALDVFAAPQGLGRGGEWLRLLGDGLLGQASTLVVDPHPQNLRAIRAYEKAGFSGTDIRPDAEGQPARVMTRVA